MGDQDRMYRWRNVMCPESEPDRDIREIDALEDALRDKPAEAEHIRALISRIDPLSHYKTFENLDFLVKAIGDMDYPRMPAVDVLWRHGQIDDARSAKIKDYIHILDQWLDGRTLQQATDACDLTASVYHALGDVDNTKRWLVMSLRKTLQEYVFTPADVIDDVEDADFVIAVYKGILGRPPSPDDLQFRIKELQEGKSRSNFIDEIIAAAEHKHHHLHHIAHTIKHG